MQLLNDDALSPEGEGEADQPLSPVLMFDPWSTASGPSLEPYATQIAEQVLAVLTKGHGPRKPRAELRAGVDVY